MDLNRRQLIGFGAAAAALATEPETAPAQNPPAPNPDSALASARSEYQRDAQRVAAVMLPRTTEPAFHFRT